MDLKSVLTRLGWVGKNWRQVLVLLVVVVVGWFVAKQGCEIKRLEGENSSLRQRAIDSDSLKEVYRDSNIVISERLSQSEREITTKDVKIAALEKHIDRQNGVIRSLTTNVSELRIERTTLLGKLKADSVGEYAEIDTVNQHFSLFARARVRPLPLITIDRLIVRDSVTVAQYEISDGLFQGVFANTNPYFHLINAEFALAVPELKKPLLTWYEGLAIGIAVGVAVTVAVSQ